MVHQLNFHEYTVSPPPRQLTPRILVRRDNGADDNSHGLCRLRVTCSQLEDAQVDLLREILGDLPEIMSEVSQRRASQARALMVETFTKPVSIIDRYREEARQHDAWRRALLEAMPCVQLEEAQERCDGTPWEATSDLLWVAHQGRRYFPRCQFTEAGAPDPTWVALVAKASLMSDCKEWELMAWVLTPHPLLSGNSPMAYLSADPKRVISLAGHTLKESRA